MVEASVLIAVLLPGWFLLRDARKCAPHRLVLSPFWYFTFLFIIAFPVRTALIAAERIPIQALPKVLIGQAYSDAQLAIALLFSLLMWLFILWGRRQTVAWPGPSPPSPSPILNPSPSWRRVGGGLALVTVLASGALMIIGTRTLADFDGAAYQSSRMGSGLIWLMPEFFIYGAIALTGWLISRRSTPLRWPEYTVLVAILVMTVWISGALFSRRLIAAVMLAIVILAVMREKRLWPLGLVAILASVFAAGFFDVLRQFYVLSDANTTWQNLSVLVQTVLIDNFLKLLSGSFEGVDHVARLLETATWLQVFSGIDYGVSWLFNAGLALVPRALWASKPLIYGGLEQMHWLYPDLFKGDFATAAIPMSFVVDFAFAFGLPFALAVALVFGRLLGTVERYFWDRAAHPAQVAVALFIFIYMFNWLRGGTIIVQSVALFSIPAALMFGLRPVLGAVFGLAGEAIGVVGGRWWGTSRIYFYPHAYLRERHLDTVRTWPQSQAVNAAQITRRIGAQVSRHQALSPSRSSWKTTWPLINIKARPKDAPDDAAIYVWGAVVATGPFITDIDNPYAFTAYNTRAVKLYRPIIRGFLESPRCLQIRCLSRACREGVRQEYGDIAAAKTVLAYPKMNPAVARPSVQTPGRCRFLFISTQFEIKGGQALLMAFKRVQGMVDGATLDLVTHLPENFAGLAAAIPGVRVHPADLSRDEIATRFLAHADVLVHPTYFDSFAMVVMEALAHGLAVIATDVYAIAEMVEDGRNGLLLPPPLSIWSGTRPSDLFSDIARVKQRIETTDTRAFEEALSHAMIKMAKDVDLRTRASHASLEMIRTRFGGAS